MHLIKWFIKFETINIDPNASTCKCPIYNSAVYYFWVFICTSGPVGSNNRCQAHLGSLQRLPPGVLQDLQPCSSPTVCPVGQRGGQHHGQPCQNHQGQLPKRSKCWVWICFIFISTKIWKWLRNLHSQRLTQALVSGLGCRFFGRQPKQVPCCHNTTPGGCWKPFHLCQQPRVCKHPSTDQQWGVHPFLCLQLQILSPEKRESCTQSLNKRDHFNQHRKFHTVKTGYKFVYL